MRDLTIEELMHVSGGGKKRDSYCEPDPCYDGHGKGKQGNNGYGNGGHDGVPGNSDHQDKTR